MHNLESAFGEVATWPIPAFRPQACLSCIAPLPPASDCAAIMLLQEPFPATLTPVYKGHRCPKLPAEGIGSALNKHGCRTATNPRNVGPVRLSGIWLPLRRSPDCLLSDTVPIELTPSHRYSDAWSRYLVLQRPPEDSGLRLVKRRQPAASVPQRR